MAKNLRWTPEQLKKNGLVQNEKGDYVKVSSLVNTGNVEKIEPHFAFGYPPINLEDGPSINLDGFKTGPKKLMALYKETGLIFAKPAGNFKLPNGEWVTIRYSFEIPPCPAPRMTQADRWFVNPHHSDPKKRPRKVVAKYFAWQNAFAALSKQIGFVLGEQLRVVFIFPLPKYLSRQKRADKMNQYHKQRPDWDNCAKAVCDAFRGADDGYVCDVRAVKMWGEKGEILIF